MGTILNLYEVLLRMLEYAELDANFKNLRTTADGAIQYSGAPGTTKVTNLNADMLDGFHASQSGAASSVVATDASSNLLLGAASNPFSGRLLVQVSGVQGGIVVNNSDTAGTNHTLFYGRANGADKFYVMGNGNVQNANNSYGAVSDSKLKTNIEPARSYLGDLCQVFIRKYNVLSDPEGFKQLGVIAQELEKIFPGMIEEIPDRAERQKTDANGNLLFEQVQARDEAGNPLFEMRLETVTEVVVGGDGSPMFAPSGKYCVPVVRQEQKMMPVPVMVNDLSRPVMESYFTGTVTKAVKYSIFLPMLITAVQDLKGQLDELHNRMEQLEGS